MFCGWMAAKQDAVIYDRANASGRHFSRSCHRGRIWNSTTLVDSDVLPGSTRSATSSSRRPEESADARTIVETNATPFRRVDIDPVTLDIIENALRNARIEMDATLVRTAISPGIR